MRILIAEDEAGIAKALKVILEKNKFSADVVYNGTGGNGIGLSIARAIAEAHRAASRRAPKAARISPSA